MYTYRSYDKVMNGFPRTRRSEEQRGPHDAPGLIVSLLTNATRDARTRRSTRLVIAGVSGRVHRNRGRRIQRLTQISSRDGLPAWGEAPDTTVVTAVLVVVVHPMERYSYAARVTQVEGMEGLRYYSVTGGILWSADSAGVT